jgi:ElaB/YqjD/DUF883 family membrane-anchored ribosome-binding protein
MTKMKIENLQEEISALQKQIENAVENGKHNNRLSFEKAKIAAQQEIERLRANIHKHETICV